MSTKLLGEKTATITGGARGIGAAIALELASRGANIVIADIVPDENVHELVHSIEQMGSRCIYVRADMGCREDVERLFSQVSSNFGSNDVLVNNAAQNIRAPLLEMKVEDVEKVWKASLWSVFHCSQVAARQMVERGRGGNIVSISSVHASFGYPRSSAYNGAKAAVNQMSRTWATELAPHGIRVNVVEPGWIETPGELAFLSEAELAAEGAKLPLGRLGHAEDIARAVSFLVSPEASYITGSCLRVDGGYVLPR